MNIGQAKNDIKNAVAAYLAKDKFGNLVIPTERQRPIFLLGAPGIGKTAVMEQIASELNIGLVSYSMTHHTRQSALGLPFIVEKEYGGKNYSVSEYTMSEIIAAVYDTIESTGMTEGILFLDEINCVSETLAPAMLQFLQYKTFGRHRVPRGWIVVTAGNPPEYNNSVREFDIVTWDRLKRIDVEADLETWKGYAYSNGTHAAIVTYLDIRKDDFYKIESTVDGKSFVTARGWSDLSEIIKLYEQLGFPVDEKLIGQYIQHPKIAKSFASYYDLFRKYRSDYQVDKILEGKADAEIVARAGKARFDERLSLLGLLIDGLSNPIRESYRTEGGIEELMNCIRDIKIESAEKSNFGEIIERCADRRKNEIERGRIASNLSADREYALNYAIDAMSALLGELMKKPPANAAELFKLMKADFDKRRKGQAKTVSECSANLSNVFKFCEDAFGEGQEMLIFVTELTVSAYTAHFIGKYGCKEYFAHNKEMMFFERRKNILREIEDLNLDDLK